MSRLYEVIRSAAKMSPPALNKLIRRYFSAANYDLWMADQTDPYRDVERSSAAPAVLAHWGFFRIPAIIMRSMWPRAGRWAFLTS